MSGEDPRSKIQDPEKLQVREAIAKVAPLVFAPHLCALPEGEDASSAAPSITEPLGGVGTRLVLPLPKGEGRGEGERGLEIADHGSFAIDCPNSTLRSGSFGLDLKLGYWIFSGS